MNRDITSEVKARIGATWYLLSESHTSQGTVVRFQKEAGDGDVYDVTEPLGGRTSCTCPDWQFRHAPLDYSDGCKHIRAAVRAGLVRNKRPAPLPLIPADAGAVLHDALSG